MMMDQKGGNFEPNPASLCTDVPDGKISEKKKKKGKICDGFSEQTQNLSSVRVQDSPNCSKMSKCGSDDASSSSFLEVELKYSKCGVCEDTETGTGRAWGKNRKKNRCLSWNWKMKREALKNWVKEPGYRYGVKHVHPPENRVWVEHDSFSREAFAGYVEEQKVSCLGCERLPDILYAGYIILELTDIGTSNDHIFGDPSKLDCLNFHDLHPASWFSVAWYPVYRIPEGNLWATFLTYHSL